MYRFHGLNRACLFVLALGTLGLADRSRAATEDGGLGAGELGLVGTTYVSSLEDNAVLRYVDGQFVEVFAAASKEVSLSRPHGILARCQDVLVASFGTDTVLRFDRATGAYLGVFLDAEDGLDAPVYIAEGPDGNLYVSSQGNDRIVRATQDGALVDDFVAEGSGGLDGPSGIAFATDGNLYVAGRYSANVIAYDGDDGTFLSVVADAADGLVAGDTFGLSAAADGQLYFASGSRVFRADTAGISIASSESLPLPIGLEVGAGDTIYVASNNNIAPLNKATLTLGAPALTGGTINTLNFFHFVAEDPCAEGEGEGEGEPCGVQPCLLDCFIGPRTTHFESSLAGMYQGFGFAGLDPDTTDLDGDGMVDRAHARLVDSVLANAGGTNSCCLMGAYLNNETAASLLADEVYKVAGGGVAREDFEAILAGVTTIGNPDTVAAVTEVLKIMVGVESLDLSGFNLSNVIWLAADGDQDLDGVCNLGEYKAVVAGPADFERRGRRRG
jgi:hypothetical protein